jgi:hypothetical protein
MEAPVNDTRQSVIVDFTAHLFDTLAYTADEFVSIGHDADGEFVTAVRRTADAPAFVATLPATANIFYSVNPTRGPIRDRAGRGKMTDVTRLAALWSDLDIKRGSCADLEVIRAIIDELSAILRTRPSVITHSGGGLHPYWPISDGHIKTIGLGKAQALVRRWQRLVAVAAEHHGAANIDNVYDLARMMRVPGTYNNKKASR